MTDLVAAPTQTMSTIDLRALINSARKDAGESQIRNNTFVERVEDELEGELGVRKTFVNAKGSPPAAYYDLTIDQCMLVGMRESKAVRREVLKKLKDLEARQKHQLPATYLQALEKLIESEKEKFRLEAENSKLNTLLDNEFGYCSILRAAVYAGVHESTFQWRPLKAMTLKLGLEVKQVPSPRYSYQNLYPIRAFEAVYPDIDFDDLKPELVDDKEKLAIV